MILKSSHNNAFILVITILIISSSCKAPSYHFVSPTLNSTGYEKAGSGHLGLQFGTIGIGAKGGVAITDNVSINGFFGGIPEGKDDYTSRESEVSIGFQTNRRANFNTKFYLGTGFGANEKDRIGLDGDYFRPFIQMQGTAFDKELFSDVYLDASFGLRVNYLIYDGVKEGANFDHKVIYTEPYLGLAVGGRNVRFELLQGVAIKTSGTWGRYLRIFPYFGNIGVLVKLRKSREKDQKSTTQRW